MTQRIADLWARGEDAERLYTLYLVKLWMANRHERVIQAARRIRRYAARGPAAKAGQFTYDQEIEVLCELGRYEEAWRQTRRKYQLALGERINFARYAWPEEAAWSLIYTIAPMLYLTKRYKLGRRLMETGLAFFFRNGREISYDLLLKVYHPDSRPKRGPTVSLRHFYRELDLDLGQWRHWDAFVDGFPERFFRAVEVPREALRQNARLLRQVDARQRGIRKARCFSGYSQGIQDVIDSPAQVRRWHERRVRESAQNVPKLQKRRDQFDAKLRELFPELREEPRTERNQS